jgi:hypothetical protein
MKNKYLFMIANMLLLQLAIAQVPSGINYQGVFRLHGLPTEGDKIIELKISLLSGANLVYQELHPNHPSRDGQFAIQIGKGVVQSGNFNTIDWAVGTYFIKSELRLLPQAEFIDLGTTQLLSVPFALLAKSTHGWKNIGDSIIVSEFSKVGIGTVSPKAKLDVNGSLNVNGWTTTKVLEITGGNDIVEYRESTDILEPGDLVVCDPLNINRVYKSKKQYDTRIIGVVSGAGGIKPGITLKQEGMIEGSLPIAIAGTIKVKVMGAIKAGDLLTSSVLPGIAMKATNKRRGQGAVLGKAIEASQNGFVTILVSQN